MTAGSDRRRKRRTIGERVVLADLTGASPRPDPPTRAGVPRAPTREARRPARAPGPGGGGHEPWPALPPGWRPWAEGIATVAAMAAMLSMILLAVLS